MSWPIVARVLKTKTGSPSAKAVLLALANYCDYDGKSCFPGQDTIQQLTELSPDTIQRQLRVLIEAGFITGTKQRSKGHWASWNYQIILSTLWDDQAAQCGLVDDENQAAPCGTAKPHHAARPSRTMRLKPFTKPFNQPSRPKAPSCPDGLGAGARCEGKQGVRVHSDSAYADGWRRYWAATGQMQPPFSQRDGYYLKPLPSLLPPPLPAESAA
jgi:hypothetical protein